MENARNKNNSSSSPAAQRASRHESKHTVFLNDDSDYDENQLLSNLRSVENKTMLEENNDLFSNADTRPNGHLTVSPNLNNCTQCRDSSKKKLSLPNQLPETASAPNIQHISSIKKPVATKQQLNQPQELQQLEGQNGSTTENHPTTNNTSEEIEEILKKQRLKAEWILQEHRIKLVKVHSIAEKESSALRYFPFDPKRLLEAPTGLRETLILLFGHMLLLHLSQLSKEFQATHGSDLVGWAQGFLNELLDVLNLVESPATVVLFECLAKFIKVEEFGIAKHEFVNPQPVKLNWLTQCEVVYKDSHEKLYKNAILKEKKPLLAPISSSVQCTLSTPQSPKSLGTVSLAHTSEEALKNEKSNKRHSGGILECPSVSSIIFRDLLMICIGRKNYDARIQVIFDMVAQALDMQPLTLRIAIEDLLLCDLAGSMKHKSKESQRTKTIRRLKVAGVAAGLGALTALTAGLAAPAIAAGVGALGLAGTSGAVTFLSTVGGSAAIASVLGASSAGLTGWKYSRRIGKIKVFKFNRLQRMMQLEADYTGEQQSSSSSFSDDEASEKKTCRASISKKKYLNAPGPVGQKKAPSIICEETGFLSSAENESNNSFHVSTTEDEKEELSSSVEEFNNEEQCFPSPIIKNEEKEDLDKKGDIVQKSLNLPSWSPNPSQLSLSVNICVSGWLRQVQDIYVPWRCLLCSRNDVYTLSWDPKVLLDLGNLVVTMLSQRFAVSAAQLWLQTTVAGALSTALMWPVAVLQYASTLDNAWMACKERAVQAGRLLADALCDRKTMGIRAVSLMGFSMGARVIFYCLLELNRRHAFNLIENVIVMGMPESCDKSQWQKARQVVSGRFINAFSPSDWLLGFLFRYMEWGVSVAGLSPVKVDGIENLDVSGVLRNHNQYADKIEDLLVFAQFFAAV